ncbi:hypothetical protein X975_20817, partial [Stegodyphus mimosarum]
VGIGRDSLDVSVQCFEENSGFSLEVSACIILETFQKQGEFDMFNSEIIQLININSTFRTLHLI